MITFTKEKLRGNMEKHKKALERVLPILENFDIQNDKEIEELEIIKKS